MEIAMFMHGGPYTVPPILLPPTPGRFFRGVYESQATDKTTGHFILAHLKNKATACRLGARGPKTNILISSHKKTCGSHPLLTPARKSKLFRFFLSFLSLLSFLLWSFVLSFVLTFFFLFLFFP